MNEEKFWCCIWGIIAGTICVITICITVGYLVSNYQFAQGGYTECTVPGHATTAWCKVQRSKE